MCKQYRHHNHHLNRPVFLPGLVKWGNLVIPHQRQSSPIGHTRAGFVDHDHDHSHWYIHHQSCLHHIHNAHPYPHRGTGQQYHLSGLNSFLRNHHLTIALLQRIIIHVPTPHLEDVHEPRHTRSIPFALLPYRLHNLLLGVMRALLEAHSPHLHVAEEIPVRRHKTSPTGHRDPIPNYRFHEFTSPLGINSLQGIHVPERINYTSAQPQHTLKPTASSCSLG